MSVQSSRIAAFLRLADEELMAAQLLGAKAPRQAAYLCQQCAEKITRAILTKAGVPFGTGHNLSEMAAVLRPL
jgi:HEPN domain-containing protein